MAPKFALLKVELEIQILWYLLVISKFNGYEKTRLGTKDFSKSKVTRLYAIQSHDARNSKQS